MTKEERREYMREWRASNPDKVKAHSALYRLKRGMRPQAASDEEREIRKATSRKRTYEANRALHFERTQKWREANREKYNSQQQSANAENKEERNAKRRERERLLRAYRKAQI